jgi:hypothetical protein
VARLGDEWPVAHRWVIGEEGVVDGYASANEAGTGWSLFVWIDESARGEGDVLWVFDEDELESRGVSVDTEGRPIPLDPGIDPPQELHDEIHLRLVTGITDSSEAGAVKARVEDELVALIRPTFISVEVTRHWEEPFHHELDTTIEPGHDSVAALRRLMTSGRGGWAAVEDDGWLVHLHWARGAETSESFLVPEVEWAQMHLFPWDSPKRRDEAERPLVSLR